VTTALASPAPKDDGAAPDLETSLRPPLDRSQADTTCFAVRRLALGDYRCYGTLRMEAPLGIIVLTGPNGAGKTNLLEAISLLAPGRGLRRARLAELERRGAAAPWAVWAACATPDGKVELATGRDPDAPEGVDRRVVRVDGRAVRGQAALANHLSILWLTPQMDRLFVEGASGRRRFLDRLVYGFDPDHARRLAALERAQSERQRLLADGGRDATWLVAIEDTVAREAIAVAAARRETIRRINVAVGESDGVFPGALLALTGGIAGWLDEMPALAAEERLRGRLAELRRTGVSDGAPHGDLDVRHLDRDLPAAQCSTGEQKALLISITLANARLHARARGAAPVLLLDEVATHLDARRREALFDQILALGAQAWLTGTDWAPFAPLAGTAAHYGVVDAVLAPAPSA
jgi:DNA replication and repair protein RecF